MDSKLIKSSAKKTVAGQLISGQNDPSGHDQHVRYDVRRLITRIGSEGENCDHQKG